jgi:hypothetical protein
MKTLKTLTTTLASLTMLSLSACGPEDALQTHDGLGGVVSQSQSLLSCSYGSTRRVAVSDGAQLQAALSSAQPGDDIVLAAGAYSRGAGFSLTRGGTADKPITIRSTTPLAAEIRSPVQINASYVVLAAVEFTGSGSIELSGTGSRITRNFLHGLDGIAVRVNAGARVRVDHNKLSDMKGRGISLDASGGVRNPVVERNHFLNWVGPVNENAHEAAQLGMSDNDSDVSMYATLQYNLFEGVGVDQETVSVKSSDNTVRFNTLRDSRNITNRHGEDNLYTANYFEDSEGLNVHDQNNELQANKCVRCKFGFRVMAGGNNPAGTSQSPAAYALNTVLRANSGPIIVGFGFGNNDLDQLPRNTRIDRANKDSVSKYVSSAAYTLFDNTVSLPTPSPLSAADVGYDAGTCD